MMILLIGWRIFCQSIYGQRINIPQTAMTMTQTQNGDDESKMQFVANGIKYPNYILKIKCDCFEAGN